MLLACAEIFADSLAEASGGNTFSRDASDPEVVNMPSDLNDYAWRDVLDHAAAFGPFLTRFDRHQCDQSMAFLEDLHSESKHAPLKVPAGQICDLAHISFDPKDPSGGPQVASGFPAVLTLNEIDHPDLGMCLQILCGTPILLGSADPWDKESALSATTVWAANELNLRFVRSPRRYGGFGAWSVNRDQLFHNWCIPAARVDDLVPPSEDRVGDLIAMLTDIEGALAEMASVRDFMIEESLSSLREPTNGDSWDGAAAAQVDIAMLQPDASVRLAGITTASTLDGPNIEWLPGIPRVCTLAAWGIFNPAGPSAVTLELFCDIVNERYLLGLFVRHFTGSWVNVVGICGIDEVELTSAVYDAIATPRAVFLSPPEWVKVLALGEVGDAVVAGWRAFAMNTIEAGEYSMDDYLYRAADLVSYVGNPWARLSHDREQLTRDQIIELVGDGDPLDTWVTIVKHPVNVEGHEAYYRSADVGARLFVLDGANAAQSVSDTYRDSAELRLQIDHEDTPQGCLH